MSDKVSTVILKVDLQCKNCSKKIKSTLCKLQDREKIKSIAYDEKKSNVTISGPFDPNRLLKKICCKAGKIILDIEIKPDPKPPPPPKQPPPDKPPCGCCCNKPDKPPCSCCCKKPDPPPPPQPPPPPPTPPPSACSCCCKKPDKLPCGCCCCCSKSDKSPCGCCCKKPEPPPPTPKPPPPTPKPPPPPPTPTPNPPPPPPPPTCGYCCRPWLVPYYGGCRCCSCGWISGPIMMCHGPPQPTPPVTMEVNFGVCDQRSKNYEYLCYTEEQDPSLCTIM